MMRHIFLFVTLLVSATAMANDYVDIDFEVTADAAACTPSLNNNGVVDFNTRSMGTLSTQAFTQLGTRDLTLSISCESSTLVAITARDTRGSSAFSGKDDQGQSGARFQENGGHYVSDQSRLFGLGFTTENKAIGSYAVQIDAAGITVTDGDKSVLVDIAGAASQNGPWIKETLLPLPTGQDYFYTFVQRGTVSPQPVSSASIPLKISATVANKLGSSQTIKLDGEAVISLVYL